MSELTIAMIKSMAQSGDKDLAVDLLTENQSNIMKITGFEDYKNGTFTIECDINDIKAFKKEIK